MKQKDCLAVSKDEDKLEVMNMSDLLQRVLEMASATSPTVGYRAKDQRREIDKRVRNLIASAYEEQRARLIRMQQTAPIAYADDLEGLNQRLERLVLRLNTAPRGYAGWFDVVSIIETDLDQLIGFDRGLAQGVAQLAAQFDALALALQKKEGVENAVNSCAETLDALNNQLNDRAQFVEIGKRPAVARRAR